MRRVLILGIFLLAQCIHAKTLSVGVEGGLNIASIDREVTVSPAAAALGIHTDGFKPVAGALGGVFAEWNFYKAFSVRQEFLYTTKGSQIKSANPYGESKTTLRFEYFEFPLLLCYRLPLHWMVKPSIFAGASYASLNKARQEYGAGGQTFVDTSTNDFSKRDVSVLVGIEGEYKNFVLGARYSKGTVPIDVTHSSVALCHDAKNRVFTVTLGYRLPLL